MKHLDCGFEPPELSIPLVKDHKDEGYIEVNRPDTPACSIPRLPLPFQSKKSRAWWFLPLEVLVFTSLWWSSAILAIVQIKHTVSVNGIFPHPFALTSMVQIATGILAWTLSQAVYSRRHAPPELKRHEVLRLLAMGTIQGLEIGLTNKALEFLTVAGRTMISSMNVFVMMGTSYVWGLERLGWLRLLSALMLVCGGVLQGLDHEMMGRPGQAIGAAIQVASMILSSQRWALAQFVLQHSPKDSGLGHMTKLQLLARILPITGFVCIPLTMTLERDCCTIEEVLVPDLGTSVLLVALGLTAMLYAELKLVKRLSAVAFNVLATIHQIPIVLAGVILQHNEVGRLSCYGFAFCLVGALVYAVARQLDRQHAGEDG